MSLSSVISYPNFNRYERDCQVVITPNLANHLHGFFAMNSQLLSLRSYSGVLCTGIKSGKTSIIAAFTTDGYVALWTDTDVPLKSDCWYTIEDGSIGHEYLHQRFDFDNPRVMD